MKMSKIFLAAVLTLSLFSCKKASTTSAPAVEFQLQTTNRSSAVNRTDAAGTITWTSGFASATQIKLEAKNTTQQQLEFKSNVAQKVNLFTSVASALGNVTIPAGIYSEVEFRIELAPSGADAALELNGTFTNGNTGVTTSVVFRISSAYEIKGEKNNVVVDNTTTTTSLTTLDLSLLTTGISQLMLSSATVTGGTIVISSTSNTALFNLISANLQLHHEAEIGHH